MNAANDTAPEPLVLAETRDGVCTLTLNRGDRFNPLSRAMIAAFETELDRLAADKDARAVVLAANGRGFCAGHDLKELRAHPDVAWQRELFDACSRMMLKLTQLPQPVIARVHGIATAAGCQLVAACDLAVASSEAKFATSGINFGLFCATPGVPVSRNVSRKRAFEMLFTGEFIDAETARAWGLVNRVVPPAEQLDEEIARLVARIAEKPRAVVAAGKAFFYRQLEAPLAQAYRLAAA